MPPKGRKKAYEMPDPLPEGEVLKDTRKKEWKLGTPLGSGGFGLIYRAAQNGPGKVEAEPPYVVKIEPHENGPLFTELHFYQRAALPDKVDSWQKKYKLAHLGVPKICGSGTHETRGTKYRFLVMPRFGSDIWQKYLACKKKFPVSTVFALALQILDALEYLHGNEYVHADIKSANLLLGYSKKDEHKVYLVDFGLVSRYRPNGKHREYKEEPKKGHNGTPEFTSIDAHKGVSPSRRGDIQILGYVMLQWLCTKLPWEDKLTDVVYVMNQKVKYSTDIGGLLKTCFKGASYPDELRKILDYAFKMGYDVEPDYDALRKLCRTVLKREGFKEGSAFDFGINAATPAGQNGDVKSPKKARARKTPLSPAGKKKATAVAQTAKSPAQTKKRKAPSQERDSSLSGGRKRTKDSAPGPSGDPTSPASPVKVKAAAARGSAKKAAATKKSAKSPAQKARAVGGAALKKALNSPAVKGAGTSTPSKKVRKRKIKPDEMTTSSTQTTPGLEKRTGRSGGLLGWMTS